MTRVVHRRKLLLFAVLSLLDLLLTWYLLQRTPGAVYESNPMAHWCLDAAGWLGLASFKAALVLLVSLSALFVSRSRPRWGGGILGFACTALAGVVAYSSALALTPPSVLDDGAPAEMTALLEQDHELDSEMERGYQYRDLLARLAPELTAGTCSLEEATAQVVASPKMENQAWLGQLRMLYPDCSDAQCVALCISLHTILEQYDHPDVAQQLAHRLEQEYRSAFAAPVPPHYWDVVADVGAVRDRPGEHATVANRPHHPHRLVTLHALVHKLKLRAGRWLTQELHRARS